MSTDVARAQQEARLNLSRQFVAQAARMLERIRDNTTDPVDRRWLEATLERLGSVASRLEAPGDPAAGDVDQATSFGPGAEDPA